MKRATRGLAAVSLFILSILLLCLPGKSSAVSPSSLLIGQIKLTSSNGQFVSIFNNTSSEIDMSMVSLAYYNYYDLTSTKLTSSRYISLTGKLPAKSYYMVNDGALNVCYKMIVNSLSLGFSTTAGTLQITQNGPANVLDSVAWSKTAVTSGNVQTLPTATNGFLQRYWQENVAKTSADAWLSVTPSATDACDLQIQLSTSSTPLAPVANTTPQSVKTVSATASSETTKSNIGLVAPELTELFPNPATPQTDDQDEFIELYNPNNAIYNLVGYRLEVGTSYSRGHTFTAGNLMPKSYTVFKITDTNLQLSNTEGQARLLSPDGTTISETPAYEDAPEGESWSLVGDSWQWTKTVTPNAANLPSPEVVGSSTTAKSAISTAAVKTTKSSTKTSTTKTASSSSGVDSSAQTLNDASPLHPVMLAGVGAAAVAYALYEYRTDLKNSLFRLRRYIRHRREVRA